ncbi:hypothetical protein FB45DRAFT_907942 [Roridomyces roridus]|uniref:Uncharacterized protein n=1 Tax=Roridomyces roridus TaxID=1738132 RepID=A0AAD7C290_9AGAR|nr:hypothetical protein FB45DRAFT_907942 [Roridomyces roridus]
MLRISPTGDSRYVVTLVPQYNSLVARCHELWRTALVANPTNPSCSPLQCGLQISQTLRLSLVKLQKTEPAWGRLVISPGLLLQPQECTAEETRLPIATICFALLQTEGCPVTGLMALEEARRVMEFPDSLISAPERDLLLVITASLVRVLSPRCEQRYSEWVQEDAELQRTMQALGPSPSPFDLPCQMDVKMTDLPTQASVLIRNEAMAEENPATPQETTPAYKTPVPMSFRSGPIRAPRVLTEADMQAQQARAPYRALQKKREAQRLSSNAGKRPPTPTEDDARPHTKHKREDEDEQRTHGLPGRMESMSVEDMDMD